MRETNFIKQNKEKWDDFEKELSNGYRDPDKLSDILIQITDDLSYSRTFYPNRSVRVYLNNLAQKIFRDIYKTKKNKSKKLISFWKEDLPLMVYQCRKQLLVSFLIFLFSATIGAISTAYDPEFPVTILGADYIQMTLENIKNGDPMGVYKKMGQMDMFLSITLNNVLVAFRTFILGVFFALGTLIIMVYNGVMIGTFQYFFFQQGLFIDSFLTIWLHGTLEISSIIIAGASGLVLGKGLLFPGTYSRLQAFQISAKQGLKIFLGVVPILVFAALIEGFVTRYTDVPNVVKGLLIFVSLLFVLYYFIYYPLTVGKVLNEKYKPQQRLQPYRNYSVDLTELKSNGKIFKDIFFIYRKNSGKIILMNLILTVSYLVVVTAYHYEDLFGDAAFYMPFEEKLNLFFNYFDNKLMFMFNSLLLTFNIISVYYFQNKFLENRKPTASKIVIFTLYGLLIMGVLNALFLLPTFFTVIGILVLVPFFFLAIFIMIAEDLNVLLTFNRLVHLTKGNFFKLSGLNFTLIFIGIIFQLVLSSPFIYLIIEALNMTFDIDSENYFYITSSFFLFLSVFSLGMILPIMAIGQGILYFTLKEINDASELRKMILKIKEG